ncbi:MAG: hypothetical protein AAGC68_07620, partial [Verrucomicrobiota bacterium]
STLDISNEDFLNGGDLTLRGNSQAAVVNLGEISAFEGDIFLVAATVDNSGYLKASRGTVGLAAGNDVLIKESGNERVFVRGASGGSKETGVLNKGTIEANVAELKSYGGNVYGMAVKNEGRVAATGVSREGGQIFLRAPGGKVNSTGSLVATNRDGNTSGRVVVDSGSGETEIGGEIRASGEGTEESGGTVILLGNTIDLFQDAVVIADGPGDGGRIIVGGGRRGEDIRFSNATDVTVSEGAVLEASGTDVGNGGEVIVFASEDLSFSGEVAARGGEFGGDGGFVELSGKENVDLRSLLSVDLSASNGEAGTLLFDPYDIEIRSDELVAPIPGSPTMRNSLTDSEINTFLSDSGSLIIESANGGWITMRDGASISWSTSNDLAIYADGEFVMENNTSINSQGDGDLKIRGDYGVQLGSSTGLPTLSDSGPSISANGSGANVKIEAGLEAEASATGFRSYDASISVGSGSLEIMAQNYVGDGVTMERTGISTTGGGTITVMGKALAGDADGIHAMDGTSVQLDDNAVLNLTGYGSGEGYAIKAGDSGGLTYGGNFIENFSYIDGTSVNIKSDGGDVKIYGLSADSVQFQRAGVDGGLTVDMGSIGRFSASSSDFIQITGQTWDMNLGNVNSDGDILISLDGNLTVESGSRVATPGNVTFRQEDSINFFSTAFEPDFAVFDAGVQPLNVSSFLTFDSSFQLFGAVDAGSVLLDGGINQSTIVETEGLFDITGFTFENITRVLGVGSLGANILRDSDSGSLISVATGPSIIPARFANNEVANVNQSALPTTVFTINGVEFENYDVVDGGGGSDTFEIKLDEGARYDGSLEGGSGSDRFVVFPGGSVARIDGGTDTDTIDFSNFTTPVFASFNAGDPSATQVDRILSMERGIGGQSVDSIIGTNGNDVFEIVGDDRVRFQGSELIGFENLDGRGGGDVFEFLNQASLSGFVQGGAGQDLLVINDRNLGGTNTYTIGNSTITRNPTYEFFGLETLSLLLGPGNDTVITRGNGLVQILDGGPGFDFLDAGEGVLLGRDPLIVGNSLVFASGFEGPAPAEPIEEAEAILATQVNNVPLPKNDPLLTGDPIDQFSSTTFSDNLFGNTNLFGGGNAFAATSVSTATTGQAVTIQLDGQQYLLGAPASLDGFFSVPPAIIIELLRENLGPDAWAELADAIDFEGSTILLRYDGAAPIALDGSEVPADIAAMLGENLSLEASLELLASLELTLSIPLVAADGPIGILEIQVPIPQEVIDLLAELLDDEAFAELDAAFGD